MSDSDAAWRDPLDVVVGWESTSDPALLRHRRRGPFWDLLDELGVTLLVTREYEHLLLALSSAGGRGEMTHLAVPHPSGLAFDAERGVVHLASTRNPNQVLDLVPVAEPHGDGGGRDDGASGTLVPVRSRTLPGRLYLHDLALVGGCLHANAVGQDAVVRLDAAGGHERVWWPKVLDGRDEAFAANHLQLNSIAAGRTLATSYFTASAAAPGWRRPGQRDFPVDGRGVVFSGRTRRPVASGLTRPHSARLSPTDGRLWVANSGYGELGVVDVEGGGYEPVVRLPGWTRGLSLHGDLAIVGTSRVLPRFHRYAPGLDPDDCVCAVHLVDLRTGAVRASLRWPDGDQLFAIEAVPAGFTAGLPSGPGRGAARQRALFYDFEPTRGKGPQ